MNHEKKVDLKLGKYKIQIICAVCLVFISVENPALKFTFGLPLINRINSIKGALLIYDTSTEKF